MREHEIIFDALHDLRTYSSASGLKEMLARIERAENIALAEICGVKIEEHGDNYDAVMAVVFPEMHGRFA